MIYAQGVMRLVDSFTSSEVRKLLTGTMQFSNVSCFKGCFYLLLAIAVIGMCISHISSSFVYNIVGEPYVLSAVYSLVKKPGSMKQKPAKIATEYKQTLVDLNFTKKKTKHYDGSQIHSILWINKPWWISLSEDWSRACEYKNCMMTKDATRPTNHSAIIFETWHDEPPRPTERPPNQVWIFYVQEPTSSLTLSYYRHTKWRSVFNWSMTYRTDSEIFMPYGYLTSRDMPPHRDYSVIFHQKSRFAAWIVSHCRAQSGRDNYVQELRRHGIPVDVLGKCGAQRVNDDRRRDLIEMGYKFYFAFENSFCPDYITEKFFAYYNMDVVLVARGGADFKQLLPNGTFINAAEFESAKDLAVYLKTVSSSESMYTEYLRNKDKYVASVDDRTLAYCDLCKKLNNKKDNYRVYDDISVFFREKDCVRPPDVVIRGEISTLVDLVVLVTVVKLIFILFKCLKPERRGLPDLRVNTFSPSEW